MAAVTPLIFLGTLVTMGGAAVPSSVAKLYLSSVWEENLARGTGQVVRRYLEGCYLVLVSPRPSPSLILLLSILSDVGMATLNLELETLQDSELRHKHRNGDKHATKREGSWEWLWGVDKGTCRALLLDHTAGDAESAGLFLASSGLPRHPRTQVVVFGDSEYMSSILNHSALRNSRQVFYISPSTLPPLSRTKLETPLDFMGHKFRIVAKNYFPYFKYDRVTELPGTLVTPTDSLGTRITETLAKKLNFTFEVREPEDNQWGLPAGGGNWTGIVGELQYEKADFCMDLTLTPQRAEVVQYSRVFIDESVVMLSSKPRPLPEYLSLVRPLEGHVWLGVVVSVMVWSAGLWVLQKLRHWRLEGRHVSFSSSVFYGWGLLLEDIPYDPPANPTGQVMVMLWLIVCFVLSSAYRSSLISHLVVQGKSAVINTFEDLVERGERDGWTWGTPRMTGALKTVLSTSPDETMQMVYSKMTAVPFDDGIQKVLEGGFSFIYSYYYSRTRVATDFTDEKGYTPIHISTTKYPLFAGNARVFRPGAPFYRRISMATQHLIESGLITFWMDDVITLYVREERRSNVEGNVAKQHTLFTSGDDGEVVLGLDHLQVTYYMLFIGHVTAFLSFVAECLSRATTQ
ncbi:hypothetical protein O3P69_013629 [Scylla paramamosain]|uniref:Ionotropic glutamate receptor L-glutamate and glycine-binding domain-containing protein n=1 Tax=Scylla paramamosain TaxID=85552 RepID=A0AAW0SQ45_SCYPA